MARGIILTNVISTNRGLRGITNEGDSVPLSAPVLDVIYHDDKEKFFKEVSAKRDPEITPRCGVANSDTYYIQLLEGAPWEVIPYNRYTRRDEGPKNPRDAENEVAAMGR